MATYSSLSDARAAYLANADHSEANDLDPSTSLGTGKARAFASACRALLLLLPAESAREGHSARPSAAPTTPPQSPLAVPRGMDSRP